jgi:DNA-binding MarR family transcriptional regulator
MRRITFGPVSKTRTAARSSGRRELAVEAWRRLFDFFVSTRPSRDAELVRLDLTPNDAKALATLEQDEGKPMRVLADAWGTDASNATWVVDRLEERGFAERRAASHDRRVKLVVLTPKGAKTKASLLRAFYEPPPELLALEQKDLRTLCSVLEQLESKGPRVPPKRA